MSVEAIVGLIERESQEEARAILAEAGRVGEDTVAQAQAVVARSVAEALQRQGPGIRAAAQRRINAVRLHLLEDQARADAARVAAVFDAAEEQIRRIAEGGHPERWAQALTRMCDEALEVAGEGAMIGVRGRDAAVVADLAKRSGGRVAPVADDAPPGVVVTSADRRISVDASLPVRAARGRSLLAEQVARDLGFEQARDLGSGSVVTALTAEG